MASPYGRNHRATRVDVIGKTVECQAEGIDSVTLHYDKLLIATGASPVRPAIAGANLPGVFLLHTMEDCFAIYRYLEAVKPRRAVIVGAGYIGLEMADALTHRGVEITVASRTSPALPTLDKEFGDAVVDELQRHGIIFCSGAEAHGISQVGDRLRVIGEEGFESDCEMVLLAAGVKPNADLGIEAGLKVGATAALLPNRRMESGVPDVYVAGDCAET